MMTSEPISAELKDCPLDKEEGMVSLLDLLTAIGEGKIIFLVITLLGTLVTLGYAMSLQRFYSAETLLLPPQQQQSQMVGTLAQLGSLVGGGGAPGGRAPDELYVAFLKTRRLQDTLIARFKLLERYAVETLVDARSTLSTRVEITSDKKTGLVRVAVDDTNAQFSADLANAYVEELKKLLSSLALTEAQQRRLFFEQQVSKAKEGLVTAELAFRKEQAESGLVVTQALQESGMRAGVELRSKIANLEVQLKALSRFSTPENPAYQRMNAEMQALKQQLVKLEEGGGAEAGKGPVHGLAAVQAYRNFRVQEATLDALIKQYEIARLDESREGPLLQQVDQATAPERVTKPKRAGIVIWGAVFSLFLGMVVAIWQTTMRRRKLINQPSKEWADFKQAWLKTF